tara:strand:+ start:595 stop:960 length:366 start_codon:yes stop_codon:yes gene_type:complete
MASKYATKLIKFRISPVEYKFWDEQIINPTFIRQAVNHYILFTDEETKEKYNYELVESITTYPNGKEESSIGISLEINGEKYEIYKRLNEWCCLETENGHICITDGFGSITEAIQYLIKGE